MSERVIQPIPFQWNEQGGVMVLTAHYRRIAARQYADGEVYLLEPSTQDSDPARKAYHAQLRDVFRSLPEDLEERFPSELHLRKWLLVHIGYCDEANYIMKDNEDAMQLALAARKLDEFAVIEVVDRVVRIRTAKSQKRGVVKPDEAKRVRDAALDKAAWLIGTTRGEVQRHGGRSA